jgi:hypothetical protein
VALWPDNFSALDWSKCSWVFEPGQIAKNIYKILGRDIEPGTSVIGSGNQRLRITTRAQVKQASLQNRKLSFEAQFPEGESGWVMVAGLDKPAKILLNGSDLAQPGSNVWRYVSEPGFLVARLSGSGPHLLEIPGVRQRSGSVFASRLSRIAFDFAGGLAGWTAASQVEDLRAEDGLLKGLATGSNPYLHRTGLRVVGWPNDLVFVGSQSATGAAIALYWITEDSPDWAEDKSIHLPFKPGPSFNEYAFAVGQHHSWAGKTVIGIRLDPADGGNGGEFAVKSIRAE